MTLTPAGNQTPSHWTWENVSQSSGLRMNTKQLYNDKALEVLRKKNLPQGHIVHHIFHTECFKIETEISR